MRSIPRLFIDLDLSENAAISLPDGQSHYLLRVMRLSEGASVTLFNGRDGEWRGQIASVQGKRAEVQLIEQTREQNAGSDLWLLFAPLRVRARMNFVVEKAVELGAAHLQPLITERTQSDRVRPEKLLATAIEAAEQTERLDIPTIAPPEKLLSVLDSWDPDRQLIYADESGDDDTRPWGGIPGRGASMADVLRAHGQEKAGILIGPEGGFSSEERARLRSLDFVLPVSLGPRILRAETAAVAALTIWQSVLGDWR